MQTGVAYCNVPSKFSGTQGLHIFLFSISSSSSVQDSFSHIEGESNDGDFNLRINVYVHLAKSVDPGQAPQLRYNVGPGYALFAFLLSRYILRSVGRQTMVFTECKLKFSPLFYQFIKQNRLRPGTAWCNTWIVSNQTVQTLIKWSVTRHIICVFSDYQTTRYGFPF